MSVPNLLNDGVMLDSSGWFTYEYKYGRSAGFIQEYVKRVPFYNAGVPDETRGRLSQKMPVVYGMIEAFGGSNLN